MDPQEIVDALSIVKQAGYVSDIKSNGGSGPVDVNLPGTSHLADGTIAGSDFPRETASLPLQVFGGLTAALF